MRRLIRFLLLSTVVGVVVWAVRNRLLAPAPVTTGSTPGFRTGPSPQSAPSNPAAEAPPVSAGDTAPKNDDLTTITGIGPVFHERLAAEGVTTFASLAEIDVATMAGRIDARESLVEDWVEQARDRVT